MLQLSGLIAGVFVLYASAIYQGESTLSKWQTPKFLLIMRAAQGSRDGIAPGGCP
jgi:hypothetical protein